MFDRVAYNHIKNGYFPTDDATLAGITERLDIGGGEVRISIRAAAKVWH